MRDNQMTRRRLHISDTISLPIDFATKTAAILAQRRKGKTYTASVIAEEMVRVKQPFVALDPTGAWWGLRASADGRSVGLPVIVLGGQHGDVPLERTGGRLIADLVTDEPGYYVIDFSLFESGEAERHFAVDFAERLYRYKGHAGKDFPLHLFVDEADRFIPQQMRRGSGETSPRLLGAFEAIVRRGGLRGLGTTLISQRAAVVNKNVLEMIDILFALRTIGPNDRKAVRAYVDAHGSDAERTVMMDSLASLGLGEAWIWEPGGDPPIFERVRIRARHTFNSSATPTGGRRVEPKRLADVDLAALTKRMAETIERAKEDDPKELRKQRDDLRKQLAAAQRAPAATPAEPIEIPVLSEGDQEYIQAVSRHIESAIEGLQSNQQALRAMGQQIDAIARKMDAVVSGTKSVSRAPREQPMRVGPPSPIDREPASDNGAIKSGMRRMLIALAQRGAGLTKKQLAVRARLGVRTGTFAAYLSRLRSAGCAEERGDRIYITDIGVSALGDYEPLPSGRDLLEYWVQQLGGSGVSRMLRHLYDQHPRRVTHKELAEAVNLNERTGTYSAYLSKLNTLELVDRTRTDVKASDEFFV